MKCPHCTIAFHPEWQTKGGFGADKEYQNWVVHFAKCPTCNRWAIRLSADSIHGQPPINRIVHPNGYVRPVAPEVESRYSTDFTEACGVLSISPKASAALSRRLLQSLLVNKGGANAKKKLHEQIDEVSPTLPSDLDDLHSIRKIGNFAAHETKDTHTGDVVDVEPGEAEWLLDVIELLFEHYFVKPELKKRRQAALDAKLAAAKGGHTP